MRPAIAILMLALLLPGVVHAADQAWTQRIDAAPVDGQAKGFRLWLPEKTPRVRGILLFTWYGSFEGYSAGEQVRQLARELECAVVASEGIALTPPGEPDRVVDALARLAAASGHPELANAPLFVFGHSNSTAPMGELARRIPARIIAWVAMKSAFGDQFSHPEIYQIPGLVVCGELDHSYFSDQLQRVKQLRRSHGALMHIIVEAGGPHWPTDPTFQVMTAFLRAAFYLRVPHAADASLGPVVLNRLEESAGWLGQNLDGVRIRKPGTGDWMFDRPVDCRQLLEIAPFADYPGDAKDASWLPSADYARKWQEYCRTGALRDWSAVPSATIEAWRRAQAPPPIDGLQSALLPAQAKRLAGAAKYQPVLEELARIAADAARPAEAAEATRLLARVGELAAERLVQAQRLESTHPPTAVAAYQAIAKRFAGIPAAEQAEQRLQDKELRKQLAAWRGVAQLQQLENGLKPAGAAATAADAQFAKVNAERLREMQALGAGIVRQQPGSPAAAAARALLERYALPCPAPAL